MRTGLNQRRHGLHFGGTPRWVVVLLAIGFSAPQVMGGEATRVLEAPVDVAVCQIDYGELGTIEVSWTNPEMYERAEFAIDGEPVVAESGAIDGADGVGTVLASSGTHEFSVRGAVGEQVSDWTTVEFLVLEESPVPQPIIDLDCEFIPMMGGMIRVRWALGADAWILGRLRPVGRDGFDDRGGFVVIEAGATSIEILTPTSFTTGVISVTFKNDDGYFSPRFEIRCEQRTPRFVRGDCDASGRVSITDAIFNLNHLFLQGLRGSCDDACDANDDGVIDLSDSVATLNHLFRGGPTLVAPGPSECGIDPTPDFLGGICRCQGI